MTDQDQSREAFEKWHKKEYPWQGPIDPMKNIARDAWQAAHEHKAAVAPTTEDSSGVVLPEPVGFVDEFGNFEKHMQIWMREEPGVKWRPVFTEQTVRALLAAAPSMPQGWTPVGERLPEPGTPVLLDIGKKHPIRAMWAAKFTLEVADCDPGLGEYDVETGEYYCPEGWYEWNEHEECHWSVSAEPISWIPLPQPPKEQT